MLFRVAGRCEIIGEGSTRVVDGLPLPKVECDVTERREARCEHELNWRGAVGCAPW